MQRDLGQTHNLANDEKRVRLILPTRTARLIA